MDPHRLAQTARPRLWIIALAAMVSACGFQLRGAPPVSPALQPLAVSCATEVPEALCLSLRDQLELGGVKLRPPEDAKFILRLQKFEQDRRATAITAQAAAAEYTLRQSVNLELISADRIPLIGDTRLSAAESYRYDETNVLARQREEDDLRRQLADRLAQQVIFRLAPLSEGRIQVLREEYEAAHSGDEKSPSAP